MKIEENQEQNEAVCLFDMADLTTAKRTLTKRNSRKSKYNKCNLIAKTWTHGACPNDREEYYKIGNDYEMRIHQHSKVHSFPIDKNDIINDLNNRDFDEFVKVYNKSAIRELMGKDFEV